MRETKDMRRLSRRLRQRALFTARIEDADALMAAREAVRRALCKQD